MPFFRMDVGTLDMVFRIHRIWFLGLTGFWFSGFTGFGSQVLLDLVLRSYWIWFSGLTGFWFSGLTGFWFFDSFGFWGFYDRILLLSLMMTQRLSIKTRDYNLFDNGHCFFDFWTK